LLSAFTLLVPPLAMAAGVMYLISPTPQGPEQKVAERADMRPELAASQRPVIVDPDKTRRYNCLWANNTQTLRRVHIQQMAPAEHVVHSSRADQFSG
jgi:hypothetical protein